MNDRRLIEAYLSGEELDAAEEARLRARVRDDRALAEHYDRVALALRAAAGKEPTQRERDRLWQRIDDELDKREREERAVPARPLVGWLRWLPALAAVLLMGGLALVVARQAALHPDSGRRMKGRGADGAPAATATEVDFEAFAIRSLGQGRYDRPRRVPDGGRIGLDDFLQFRYRNVSAGLKQLYLAALGGTPAAAAASTALYFPRPGSDEPLSIARTAKMTGAGRSIRLRARHRAGRLTVVGLFAARKHPRARIEKGLRVIGARIARGGRLPARLLIDGDVLQVVSHSYQITRAGGRSQ